MRQRPFGKLGAVSALTLGGGGFAQIWGPTTREECVATVREAVDSGIDLLDLAPSYGSGEAEAVIGAAFDGRLPAHVRVTTKCRVGDTPPAEVYDLLSGSLAGSLERMKLDHVDVMFLHNAVTLTGPGDERVTTAESVAEAVVPAFERLIAEGRIRHWGLTGIGQADALIKLLAAARPPTTSSASPISWTPPAACCAPEAPPGRARSSPPPTPPAPPSWASAPSRPAPSPTPSTGPCPAATRSSPTTSAPRHSAPSPPRSAGQPPTSPTSTRSPWTASPPSSSASRTAKSSASASRRRPPHPWTPRSSPA